MPVLDVKEIHKSYHQSQISIPVLQGVTLSLDEGQSIAITGASGVGKSTLLHCIGLLDRIDLGAIDLEGRLVSQMSQTEMALCRQEKIGFVFQFHYLMAELTALENVMVPMMIAKRDEKEARQRAEEWLGKVGLENRLHHLPSQLSGGEQQRVAIARALVCHPRLILADEPTGNLDTQTASRVFDLLVRRSQELKSGFIMATHNLELASRLDEQGNLREGRLE